MRRGLGGCARWLDLQLYEPSDPEEPFYRWNVRNCLLAALNEAHATLRAPTVETVRAAPKGLLPEEAWHFTHFAESYCHLFASEPGVSVPHGCEHGTLLGRRSVLSVP